MRQSATAQYKPQLFNRVGNVDLNALTAKVAQDIAMADAWQRKRGRRQITIARSTRATPVSRTARWTRGIVRVAGVNSVVR